MGDCICVRRGDGPEGCGICNETGTTPDIAGLSNRDPATFPTNDPTNPLHRLADDLQRGRLKVEGVKEDVTYALSTLERQADEIERLRRAMTFYAEPENWHGTYCIGHAPMNDDWDDALQHPLYPDGKPGKRARAALTGEDR